MMRVWGLKEEVIMLHCCCCLLVLGRGLGDGGGRFVFLALTLSLHQALQHAQLGEALSHKLVDLIAVVVHAARDQQVVQLARRLRQRSAVLLLSLFMFTCSHVHVCVSNALQGEEFSQTRREQVRQ